MKDAGVPFNPAAYVPAVAGYYTAPASFMTWPTGMMALLLAIIVAVPTSKKIGRAHV